MTVFDNIGFALKLKKTPKDEIHRRVHEAAKILELEENLDRKPGQLSGGQRQRVAMGRAIVRQPAAFLMDEPLSNLDAKLRVQMRAEIARIQRNLGTTTIYVTHDQVEAMTMGDRVAVLKAGELQQVDAPQALYDHPNNVFVAAFIGSPSMNLLDSHITAVYGAHTVDIGSQALCLDDAAFEKRPALRGYVDKPVVVGIRPEDIDDAELTPEIGEDRHLRVRVELMESLGSEVLVHFAVDASAAVTGDPDALDEVDEAGTTMCIAKLDPHTGIRLGQDATLAVYTDRLHFFDPDTGAAIWG
jgi:multiple sugar transport system ATP-binding protein